MKKITYLKKYIRISCFRKVFTFKILSIIEIFEEEYWNIQTYNGEFVFNSNLSCWFSTA